MRGPIHTHLGVALRVTLDAIISFDDSFNSIENRNISPWSE